MSAVLLTGDLTVVSRVEGAALRTGMPLRAVSSVSQAVDFLIEAQAELLIVDLATPSLDVQSLVGQLKAGAVATPHVVAFGPHVHEERLAAAREAGCDEVVSRGQFFAQLDAILRR